MMVLQCSHNAMAKIFHLFNNFQRIIIIAQRTVCERLNRGADVVARTGQTRDRHGL